MITRRDLLKILLSTALAESVDVEQMLWVPKPIITVPALPAIQMFLYGSIHNPTRFVSWNPADLNGDHTVITMWCGSYLTGTFDR